MTFSNNGGDMGELLLKRVLRHAGYDLNSWQNFSSIEEVKSAFEMVNPRYLSSALTYATGGKKNLLDQLGADYVIQDQQWLGLDVTLNPLKISGKRDKTRKNSAAWDLLGLHCLGVVHIDYTGREYELPDFLELPEEMQEDMLNKLYDFIDFLKDSKEWGALLTIEYPTYQDLK